MKRQLTLIMIIIMEFTIMSVTIEFHLKTSPGIDKVYITGNLPELSDWDPSRISMKKDDDIFKYSINISSRITKEVEYKYTLGNWSSVEKDDSGKDVENHKIDLSGFGKNSKLIKKDQVMVFGNSKKKIESTLSGDFDIFELFGYKIIVYLPPDYKKDIEKDYPLLIMHDGQNLFDRATAFGGNEWECDESAQRMIKKGIIQPVIIAGIYNRGTKRMKDYTPTFDKNIGSGGEGNKYLDYIVKRLLPYLRLKYRISNRKGSLAMGGSSLGGLISLYSTIRYPETFKNIMAISPSIWWDDRFILKNIKRTSSRIWLDIGTLEGDIVSDDVSQACLDARSLYFRMKKLGCNVFYKEYKGAVHNERSWSERFPEILEYFYKKH